MAVKRIVNLPTVNGWTGTAAGAFSAHTVVVDIPIGPTYHAIWISGNAGASKKFHNVSADGLFGEIRLKVNGKVQRTFTGTELLKLNALNGAFFVGNNGNVNATDYTVPIWFAEPWRKAVAAQEFGAWGTGNLSSFQLECDIVAYSGAAAGLTQPVFQAEIDDSLIIVDGSARTRPMGVITKWFNIQYPIQAASTWHDFSSLPKRDFYQSLHVMETNIDEVEVKLDNSIYRQPTQTNNYGHLKGREMDPQPSSSNHCPARSTVDVVFDHDDLLNSALPRAFNGRRVQDFNFRLKSAAAGTIPRNAKVIFQLAGAAE